MTLSAVRTLTVPASIYGAALPLAWPQAEPGDDLDYGLDLTALMLDASDVPATIEAMVMPSGAGELAILDLTCDGTVAAIQLSGGVAGRTYRVSLAVGTVAGRTFVLLVSLPIDPAQEVLPVIVPPDWGFGAQVSWTSGATVFGPAILAVANGLVLVGTGQSDGLALPAQANGISSAPPGAAGILPAILSGTIVVVNYDPANGAPVFPPAGGTISSAGASLGENQPFVVGAAGSRISFQTSDGVNWVAA